MHGCRGCKKSAKKVYFTNPYFTEADGTLYINVSGANSAVGRFASTEFILSLNFLQKSAQKVYFTDWKPTGLPIYMSEA